MTGFAQALILGKTAGDSRTVTEHPLAFHAAPLYTESRVFGMDAILVVICFLVEKGGDRNGAHLRYD